MEPEIQRLMAKHKAEMASAAEQAAQSTRSVDHWHIQHLTFCIATQDCLGISCIATQDYLGSLW